MYESHMNRASTQLMGMGYCLKNRWAHILKRPQRESACTSCAQLHKFKNSNRNSNTNSNLSILSLLSECSAYVVVALMLLLLIIMGVRVALLRNINDQRANTNNKCVYKGCVPLDRTIQRYQLLKLHTCWL